jgi:hypothetical protein
MRKLKYVKLFENFQFQYFKPEVIKKLNDELYDNLPNDINYLIKHWIEEIAKVIKSVEPFKNIKEMEVDASKYGSITVDWNGDCRPFTINFSSCGRAKSGSYEEYEGISIEFSTEGPNGEDSGWSEIENLSTEKFYGSDGNSIEFHFTEGESSGTFYPDNWDFDAFERLFRNIEKSVYKESEKTWK